MANYRNHILTDLARLAPHCMVPSCGVRNAGQVVAMHSNQGRDGKGTAIKASDAAIAFGCDRCHAAIDYSPTLTREERVGMWEGAHRATMRWLIESGHLVPSVESVAPPPPKPKAKRAVAKGGKIPSRPFEKSVTPKAWPKRSFPKRSKG